MSSKMSKLIELQMHLEYARRILDELTSEAIQEKTKIEVEERWKEEIENNREIRPHPMMKPMCRVRPASPNHPPPPPPSTPSLAPPFVHPRLRGRRPQREETFVIPVTEDWNAEANHSAFAFPVSSVNRQRNWAQRCICGARPGRCPH